MENGSQRHSGYTYRGGYTYRAGCSLASAEIFSSWCALPTLFEHVMILNSCSIVEHVMLIQGSCSSVKREMLILQLGTCSII